VLGAVAAQLGFEAALDRAALRPTARRGALTTVLRAIAPRPRAAAALFRRDVAVLLRGGFPRGTLVLVALPLGLVLLAQSMRDVKEEWQVRLLAYLVQGVLATACGYLFGFDFPRARRAGLALERAQPVRGGDVILSRAVEAAIPALALALLAALVVASHPRPSAAEAAGQVALGASLISIALAHHGAVTGLMAESGGGDAMAAAYPPLAGAIGVGLAIATVIHPALALLYFVLHRGQARQAAAMWDRAEVEVARGSGE
jgi:hypothetical protein